MRPAKVFIAGPDDAGKRFDKLLRRLLPGLTLAAIYKALRLKDIRLNGGKAAPDSRVEEGDEVSVTFALLGAEAEGVALLGPAAESFAGLEEDLGARRLPGDLLAPLLVAEEGGLLFLSKPAGMPSHGEGGLEELVRAALAERRAASLSFSPGPLHRLDRNTSGLITFPASAAGGRAFVEALQAGRLRKWYLALVEGRLEAPEAWLEPLARDPDQARSRVDPGGRPARSFALPFRAGRAHSLVLVRIETGFTHQIRAHAAFHGHPLAGDRKYGGGPIPGRGAVDGSPYYLHAWRLELPAGLLGPEPRILEAPLPPAWEPAAERLLGLGGRHQLEALLATARGLALDSLKNAP